MTEPQRRAKARGVDASAPRAEEALGALRTDLEGLGLSGNEALVVLALLRLGTATSMEVARACNITRTNVYQLLEDLTAARLIQRLPGDGPATWGSIGHEELLARLYTTHEERLAHAKARADRLRTGLAEVFADAPSAPLSSVHLVGSALETKRTYDAMLQATSTELVMFTRSPFALLTGRPNPAVTEPLARGVRMRVLYRQADLADRGGPFRAEIDAYHALGVEGRVLDDLPMKLIVFDRAAVLLGLVQGNSLSAGYPTFLRIDDPGFAEFQAVAFEQLWSAGRPVD